MLQKIRAALLATTLIAVTGLTHANDNGLLHQYKLAIANDATLAATTKRHQSTLLLEDIADAALSPTLSASANAAHDLTTNTNTDSYSVSLGMNLLLEAIYAQDVATATIQQSTQNLQASQQNIILQTLTNYFDVVKQQIEIRSIKAQIRSSKENLATIKKQGELGLATPLAIANIDNNVQQLVLNLLQAKQQLHITRNTLALSTGLYVNENLLGLADDFVLPKLPSLDLAYWWQLALNNNFNLQIQKSVTEKAYHNFRQVKASGLPTGNISLNYLSNANSNLTLAISGNIYDSGLKSAQANQAKLGWQADQDTLKSTADATKRQIDNTLIMLSNSLEQIALLDSVLTSAKNTFVATQQEYELGLKQLLDVLEAEQQIAISQMNLVKARYDHLVLQANLKQLAGTLVEADLIAIDQQLKN